MKRTLRKSMLVLLAGLALGARAASADTGGHARVSAVSGDLLVRGPEDAEWSYVDRNAVVYDGDEVWADVDSLAELELERGAWLRLAPDTQLGLRRLLSEGSVRLNRGSLYVELSRRAPQALVVGTPSGDVEV